MKKTIYAKYSNDRADRYKILTRIVEKDGKKLVEKLALCETAKGHIQHIKKVHDMLRNIKNSQISINKSELVEDGLCLEYLHGNSLEKILMKLCHKGEYEEVYKLFDEFVDRIEGFCDCEYYQTEDFVKVFGNRTIKPGLRAMSVSDIDIIFSNIIVNDSGWHLIDYEWTFEFPVPVRYVIYRSIQGFIHAMGAQNNREVLRLWERTSMDENERAIYQSMEESFQRYVKEGYYTSSDMYEMIGKRNIPVWEAVEAGNYKASMDELKEIIEKKNGVIEEQRITIQGQNTAIEDNERYIKELEARLAQSEIEKKKAQDDIQIIVNSRKWKLISKLRIGGK